MDLYRITDYSFVTYTFNITDKKDERDFLNSYIEKTEQKSLEGWHPLIARSFTANPEMLRIARFRPIGGKNVFYGSEQEETAVYEAAFYILQEQRQAKTDKTELITKNIFSVIADDSNAIDIRSFPNHFTMIDKNNYFASHQFIENNPQHSFIIYPSCRDPRMRNNAAILDIKHLEKTPKENPKWESIIKFIYDQKSEKVTCLNYEMTINWQDVS